MRSPDPAPLVDEITRNGYVWTAILVGVSLLLAATCVPVLAEVLSVRPPDARGWALVLAFSLVPVMIVRR